MEETARVARATRTSRATGFKPVRHADCLRLHVVEFLSLRKAFPSPEPRHFAWARIFLEEGGRVERPRPLSRPTPVRAERTCRCTKPSKLWCQPADLPRYLRLMKPTSFLLDETGSCRIFLTHTAHGPEGRSPVSPGFIILELATGLAPASVRLQGGGSAVELRQRVIQSDH